MNIILWILAGVLALAFLAAGGIKLATPKAQLAEKGMAYVEDFSDGQIKAIGVLEVLGAVGVIVPAFMRGLEWLVPAAATGLVLVMAGAIVTHVRRKESFTSSLALGVLAALLAVGRFWIEGF